MVHPVHDTENIVALRDIMHLKDYNCSFAFRRRGLLCPAGQDQVPFLPPGALLRGGDEGRADPRAQHAAQGAAEAEEGQGDRGGGGGQGRGGTGGKATER